MTFWTKAAAKQKAFLLRLRGAMRERDGEMEEGRGGSGDTSPFAALHIIYMVYTLQGPHHANDS